MMESIAGAATDMSAVQVANQYSVSVAKKAMDTTEQIAENLLEMLPATPAPAKGQFIDTYA